MILECDLASSAGFTVLFWRISGKVGREQEVTVMPAKCLQGDDLLGMLAHAYKSNYFVYGIVRDKSSLPGPRIVC